MASTSEKTIAKNVTNLNLLITNYINMGDKYNPGQTFLKIPALTTLHDDADSAQKALNEEEMVYRRVAAGRKDAFDPLERLITRCLQIFQLSDASPTIQDGIKTIADKVRGISTNNKPAPPADPNMTPAEQKHSTIQQSYVMQAENLGRFIEVLRLEPTYLPDGGDQGVDALDALVASLIIKNEKTDEAFVLWRSKLTDRDKIFFEKTTGLVDVALKSKKYVSGKLGTSSAEYLAIRGITFYRKPKQK